MQPLGQPITSEHLERERRDGFIRIRRSHRRELNLEQAAVEELKAGGLATAKNMVAYLVFAGPHKPTRRQTSAQPARRELEHATAQAKAAAQAATDSSRGSG